jgi:hydroxyacylglutathione hydrolase
MEEKGSAWKGLTVSQLKKLLAGTDDLLVLDSRKATDFTHGFIHGSISVGLEGRFSFWVRELIKHEQPIVVVAESGRERETLELLRVAGFHHLLGYLEGGMEAWTLAGEQVDLIIDILPDELLMDLNYDENLLVVDVRTEDEFRDGHVEGAQSIPLKDFADPASMALIQDTHNLYIHCGRGYRSVVAASILKRNGFHNLRNVLGGWDALKIVEGMPIVNKSST